MREGRREKARVSRITWWRFFAGAFAGSIICPAGLAHSEHSFATAGQLAATVFNGTVCGEGLRVRFDDDDDDDGEKRL